MSRLVFSEKLKKKKIECRLLQILLSILKFKLWFGKCFVMDRWMDTDNCDKNKISPRMGDLTQPDQGGHALWKTGKTGKMVEKIPSREKSGNLKFCWKSGKNQGISKNLIFVRSKYSNFIAVQMWLLVVSFCHMLKIPADLIILKGGVLVRWSTCLNAVYSVFSFSHSEVDILLQTQCLSLNFDAKIYISAVRS